jgi:nucleotide-binding universal stress UspA family protein
MDRANPDDRRPRPSYRDAMQTLDRHSSPRSATLFGSVVCVTDETAAGGEAVRQAAKLAGAGGSLDLLALAPEPPRSRPRPQAAQIEALVRGSAIASRSGVHPTVHIVETSDESAAVERFCRGAGLLVLGAGPLADAALARADIPVLVVRPAAGVPASVLIAVDGTEEAHAAALAGARLAAGDDADVALVATPEHDSVHQGALLRDAAAVERITGRRPLILDEHAAPVPSILSAAATLEASLIVLGSRLGRPPASVSAEVARRAGCSVLVLRRAAPVSSRADAPA